MSARILGPGRSTNTRPGFPMKAARALKVAATAAHSIGDSWAPLMRSMSAPARNTSSAHRFGDLDGIRCRDHDVDVALPRTRAEQRLGIRMQQTLGGGPVEEVSGFRVPRRPVAGREPGMDPQQRIAKLASQWPSEDKPRAASSSCNVCTSCFRRPR